MNMFAIFRSAGNSADFAVGHQDEPAGNPLDGLDLKHLSAHDVIERSGHTDAQMACPGPVEHQCIQKLFPCPADELECSVPIQAHVP